MAPPSYLDVSGEEGCRFVLSLCSAHSVRDLIDDQAKGAQAPRVLLVPEYVSSAGVEAVELCRMAGLGLDPWQEMVLTHALGERQDGKWAALEVGLCVPRQNGKGTIEEARELAGLFLLDERLLIHTAHLFKTSLEAFRRLLMLIEGSPDLDRMVQRVSKAHGEEGITLKNGARIQFATRTLSAGRGLSGDLVVLDEAMYIAEATIDSLAPVLSAKPNPQILYAGSAVDQVKHDHGVVFARVRDRGHVGTVERLLWAEWSLPFEDPELVPADVMDDPEQWALANPGLGRRVTVDFVREVERETLSERGFATERLGVGDWPATDNAEDRKITVAAWGACQDVDSTPLDSVCFAFDMTPDRGYASICVAGRRADGLPHVEVVDHRPGTAWVAARLAELVERHGTVDVRSVDKRRTGSSAGVVWGEGSPAAALLPKLVEQGVEAWPVKLQDNARACGVLYDAVQDKAIRHLGTTELLNAIKGAAVKPAGDAWVWSRRSSRVDISPLVACTLALWGLLTAPAPRPAFDIHDYRITTV